MNTLYVDVVYNADTRMMNVAGIYSDAGEITDGNVVATTGDNLSTEIWFNFVGTDLGTLDGYSARVEFGIYVTDEETGESYHPYLPLDYQYDPFISLPSSILSAVKCGKLPFQLVFSKLEDDEKIEFHSRNTINLAINRAIDALQVPSSRNPKFGDAIYNVTYDESTSTFVFTQVDGTQIEIAVNDLSEEHFEVDTYDDLITLSEAKNGDTATALDTGVWYKLYGSYDNLNDWYEMGGKRTTGSRFTLDFTEDDSLEIPLYRIEGTEYIPYVDANDGTNLICTFYDNDGIKIELPYQVSLITHNGKKFYTMIATCMIPEIIYMEASAIPSDEIVTDEEEK